MVGRRRHSPDAIVTDSKISKCRVVVEGSGVCKREIVIRKIKGHELERIIKRSWVPHRHAVMGAVEILDLQTVGKRANPNVSAKIDSVLAAEAMTTIERGTNVYFSM